MHGQKIGRNVAGRILGFQVDHDADPAFAAGPAGRIEIPVDLHRLAVGAQQVGVAWAAAFRSRMSGGVNPVDIARVHDDPRFVESGPHGHPVAQAMEHGPA